MCLILIATSPDYGTRATTVILVDRKNRVQFWERSLDAIRSGIWEEVHYDFQA